MVILEKTVPMADDRAPLLTRLAAFPPFSELPPDAVAELDGAIRPQTVTAGTEVFREGDPLAGLYVIEQGAFDIRTDAGDLLTRRGPGHVMGDRGLLRGGGRAMTMARAVEDSALLMLEPEAFRKLVDENPTFARWFARPAQEPETSGKGAYATGLTALEVGDLMARSPVTCRADMDIQSVAQIMRDRDVGSILVMTAKRIEGIVTIRDLAFKVVAGGLGADVPVARVMTPNPLTIAPEATGLEALTLMAANRINHLPVASPSGRVLGMIARTDLFRQQAVTASRMAAEIVAANDIETIAATIARIPELLCHLVAAKAKPYAISRRITDLADAATQRLLAMAETELGPPPVPYLWAACGSQGRREMTGVSDQDNCLILDDAALPEHDIYFEALARFVCDGLNRVGFVYCPGDMMATNARWRQPRRVWRGYFDGWIAQPDEEAQMLASVMFDLRAISGQRALFTGLQEETLAAARRNSIFVRHMLANGLKHTPPLSLFRGFALIRSGEHKNTLDLKHNGVVPIADLARFYALAGGLAPVNTHDRIEAAREAGGLSESGARDLLDAYDLIAQTRLQHQAEQVAEGHRPDNFMAPASLSDLQRSHLRDAFMVVKTMQAAASQSVGG